MFTGAGLLDNSYSLFLQIFFLPSSLFVLLGIHLRIGCITSYYPTAFGCSVLGFFWAFFSSVFHFGQFLFIYIFKLTDCVLSYVKATFLICWRQSSSLLLNYSCLVSRSLLKVSTWPCMLSTFSTRAFNVLIIALLNSSSDSFTSESDSVNLSFETVLCLPSFCALYVLLLLLLRVGHIQDIRYGEKYLLCLEMSTPFLLLSC